MRRIIGVALFSVGTAVTVVGSIAAELLTGDPSQTGLLMFFGGAAVAALGLTIWHGRDWLDRY